MSKFEVTVINPKSPFATLANKRLDELQETNPYKKMFEAIDCDNKTHKDYPNKATINIADSTFDITDSCCWNFQEKIRRELAPK